jgi:hypothetical protein
MTRDKKLNKQKEYEMLLDLIATEDPILHNLTSTAEKLNVDRVTLYKWLDRDEVVELLRVENKGARLAKLRRARAAVLETLPLNYLERYEQSNNPASSVDLFLEKMAKAFK